MNIHSWVVQDSLIVYGRTAPYYAASACVTIVCAVIVLIEAEVH